MGAQVSPSAAKAAKRSATAGTNLQVAGGTSQSVPWNRVVLQLSRIAGIRPNADAAECVEALERISPIKLSAESNIRVKAEVSDGSVIELVAKSGKEEVDRTLVGCSRLWNLTGMPLNS